MASRPRLGSRVVAAAAATLVAVGLGFWWLAAQMTDERQQTGTLASTQQQVDAVAAAQGHIGAEVGALVALDAFQVVPPAFQPMQVAGGQPRDRDSLLDTLIATDANGPELLAGLEHSGLHPPGSVAHVLGQLDDRMLDGLRSGQGRVEAAAYADAWEWARRESGRARDRGDVAGARLQELARRDDPWRDPTMLAVAAAIVVAVVAVSLLLRWSVTVALRRNEAREQELASRNEHLTSLFAVVRSLGNSLDTDQLAATVAERAVDGTDAEFALVVLVEGDMLVPIGQSGPVSPVPAGTAQGVTAQVVDNAQPLRAVVDAEPLLGAARGPLSIAAVPLVAGGRVRGVLLIGVKRAALMHEDDELALELLAMCAAPALEATQRHGSTAELAMIDELTGLHNKRRLQADLASTVADCGRGQLPVALAMVDVDHFKLYNDTRGHPAGDRALRRVAGIVRSCVREQDRVYRYGGEELAVLLPATHLGDALTVAERIRAGVALDGEPGDGVPLTVSIGVASALRTAPAGLVAAADAALYRAKETGRNRVEAAGEGDTVADVTHRV